MEPRHRHNPVNDNMLTKTRQIFCVHRSSATTDLLGKLQELFLYGCRFPIHDLGQALTNTSNS